MWSVSKTLHKNLDIADKRDLIRYGHQMSNAPNFLNLIQHPKHTTLDSASKPVKCIKITRYIIDPCLQKTIRSTFSTNSTCFRNFLYFL